MSELSGKVIIITGGSSGIGLAIIKRLLNTDVKFVAMFELDTPNSRKEVEELEKVYETKIGFYPCDVTNTPQLEGHFERVFLTHGTVDILINNAGIGTENVPERLIDINYKAVVLGSLMMIKRVGKHHDGKGGTIVNIASIFGLQNVVYPIYCSAKHAVVSFTRTMEQHFDVTGVRVVAVCPGGTDTPIFKNKNSNLDFVPAEPPELASIMKLQSPDNVALAVIKIIEEGKCGDIWISEHDQPPYEAFPNSELKFSRSNS